MNYSFKCNLQLDVKLPDRVFNFIKIAVKMNTVINPKSADGRYWLSCIQERRTKKTTTFSIKQLEHIIISSIQPFLYNFDYNQEYREFIFDVHTVLTDLLEEAKLEQKKLNDSYTKQTTSIVFI